MQQFPGLAQAIGGDRSSDASSAAAAAAAASAAAVGTGSADVAQPVFQVYAEEISLALGVDGYRELCTQTGVVPKC